MNLTCLRVFDYFYFHSLSGYKPFVGDHIEDKICKGINGTTKSTKHLFSNISNNAQDIIVQLLEVDYIVRFDFDKVLKHFWFEKDILMKQKVHDIITEVPKILQLNIIPSSNKENVNKKIKFCPCLTHATVCNSQCT